MDLTNTQATNELIRLYLLNNTLSLGAGTEGVDVVSQNGGNEIQVFKRGQGSFGNINLALVYTSAVRYRDLTVDISDIGPGDMWFRSDLGRIKYTDRDATIRSLGIAQAGTDEIANSTTSKTVAHGCSFTPAAYEITITPTENPTNTPGLVWVDGIDGTNFVVNCENDPGASGLSFAWAVRQ